MIFNITSDGGDGDSKDASLPFTAIERAASPLHAQRTEEVDLGDSPARTIAVLRTPVDLGSSVSQRSLSMCGRGPMEGDPSREAHPHNIRLAEVRMVEQEGCLWSEVSFVRSVGEEGQKHRCAVICEDGEMIDEWDSG